MRIGRVYDAIDDLGPRVLVDRLWPRGMKRGDPRVGTWLKEVAPSTELRRWYGHVPERHAEFVTRYTAELDAGCPELTQLLVMTRTADVLLVTATKDVAASEVPVLARWLKAHL